MKSPTECLLLGLIHARPLTSYEVHKALRHLAAHHFSSSYGTINPALKRLEKRGWLQGADLSEGGRRKRQYTLTEAGRQAFAAWMSERDVADQGEHGMLVRLFFLGLVPEAERVNIVRNLAAAAEAVAGSMAQQRTQAAQVAASVEPALKELAASQLAALDYGIAHHHFVAAWLRERFPGWAP